PVVADREVAVDVVAAGPDGYPLAVAGTLLEVGVRGDRVRRIRRGALRRWRHHLLVRRPAIRRVLVHVAVGVGGRLAGTGDRRVVVQSARGIGARVSLGIAGPVEQQGVGGEVFGPLPGGRVVVDGVRDDLVVGSVGSARRVWLVLRVEVPIVGPG